MVELLPVTGAGVDGDGVAVGMVGLTATKLPYDVAVAVRVCPDGIAGLPSWPVGKAGTPGKLGTLGRLLVLLLGEARF